MIVGSRTDDIKSLCFSVGTCADILQCHGGRIEWGVSIGKETGPVPKMQGDGES